MSPRPEATRALLLQHALRCFAEYGYEGTSIRKIAESAGVSLGLLYHYFPSKEAVLEALFMQSVELIQGCFAEVIGIEDGWDRLVRLLEVSFRVMREHREFYRVSYGVRNQVGVLQSLQTQIAAWNEGLRGMLSISLAEAGVQDPETRAWLLMASLDGISQHYALNPDLFPLEAAGRQLIADLSLARVVSGPDPKERT